MYKPKYYDPEGFFDKRTWDSDGDWYESRAATLEYTRANSKLIKLELALRNRLREVQADQKRGWKTEPYIEALNHTADRLAGASIDLTSSNFLESYSLWNVLYGGKGWVTFDEKSRRVEECMDTVKYHVSNAIHAYNEYGSDAKRLLSYQRVGKRRNWFPPEEMQGRHVK